MQRPNAARRREPTWAERGSAAVDHGDLAAARECFAEAVRGERGHARHRYHLAIIEEALGNLDAAGAGLTEALRIDPGVADAARRLSLLASRCDLPGAVPLNPTGLRAALAHATVDRDPVAEAALRQLARGTLGDVLAKGHAEGWPASARALCLGRTAPLLKNELFLAVLRTSSFRHPELERLLTALRRALLMELPRERLEDRALADFVLALAQQCEINEHVWSVADDEARRLDECAVAAPAAVAGDLAASRALLIASLYRPLTALLGTKVTPQQAAGIRPRALRELAMQRLADAADERAQAVHIPRLGAIAEPTACAIQRQYEANPYPRWSSVGVIAPAQMRRTLALYFKARELAVLDRPFEVLIAGCGTGQQAVQAALAYGPLARVLAIDLSAASLAYAARMAERFGAGNVRFLQADLQALAALDPQYAGRFDVIECTGVLHHLTEPMRGWRALLECLAPDGRMLLGLYSATARRGLKALRGDPAYPGAGCPDVALRAFRQILLDRPPDTPGGDLKMSRDFYSTSNFRDLALHVSEQPLTLEEIAQFLDENRLEFRGFQLERGVLPRFRERFPGAGWPGAIQQWDAFEAENPHVFAGMYNFWCARR
ncbi:MAG TPA: methyltransferase domain-containing protein [Hyphomicrobiaceae bacterium]|nr:methyltransferase domain-containing protein [Hyphomicrobiaceae bacterium]